MPARVKLFASGAFQILLFVVPWPLRRLLLRGILGFRLHPKSRIGMAVIFAERVTLGKRAHIGHFTLVSPIGSLIMGEHASIGRGNRIVGAQKTHIYDFEPDRRAELVMERHSSFTRSHLIDCSNTVTVGEFTIVAGYGSQVMTHSPDFKLSRQITRPIRIGKYCFIGTRSIILQGVEVPDYSIVAAGSIVNRSQQETHSLYAGNPAKRVAALDADLAYFHRTHVRFFPPD